LYVFIFLAVELEVELEGYGFFEQVGSSLCTKNLFMMKSSCNSHKARSLECKLSWQTTKPWWIDFV